MGFIFHANLFGFILLLFNLHYTTSCFDASAPVQGNMTKDYDLLVGSTLSVECNLFSSNVVIDGTVYNATSDNLIIKFGKSVVEDLVILDPFSVSYSIDNATVNDTGIYTCYVSLPELKDPIVVCTTYVAVGYPPLPIEDFSCLSTHYKNLTCSWIKPFNPVKTNYEIWDYFNNFLMTKRRCPEMINSTTCRWRLDSYPPYRKSAKTLYFLLIGNNTLGSNRQSIIIDHFKFVKPDKVQKLHFSNVTKQSLVVVWSAPSGMEYNDFPPGLLYSIKYCPVSPVRKSCMEVESTGGAMTHTIENLVPFTEYDFKVRCRSPVAEGEDMWSPTTGLSITTLSDVPYLAPKVTFSSYEVKTILGSRSITIFWKAIPSEYQNGKNLHYIIQHHIHYVRTKRKDVEINVGNVTSFTFKHMDTKTAYLFKIFAQNDDGPAMESSLLVVDKNSKLLSPPRDFAVLSHGRANYTVSWTKSPDAKSYTLFWCQEIKPWPFKCEGPLQWMHTEDTYHELNLYDIDTNFQFAVSANSGNQTSGMKWATCFVPYSGVLYKVKSVNLTPKNSTSIQVQWTLDCNAQRTVIKEYGISYCRVEGLCTGDRRNMSCAEPPTRKIIHQAPLDEYIIGHLKPYTCYRVLVRARTEDGWSEDSDVKYELTLPSAPSDSPRNVKVVGVNDTSIFIQFRQPLYPNGKITRYMIYYTHDNATLLNMPKHHVEISAGFSSEYIVEIARGIFYYTNYSIEVTACVDKSCSPLSKPVFALTGIGNPGIMESPQITMINSSYINITWKPPSLPNGPIEMYEVAIRWNENSKDASDDNEIREVHNITDSTFFTAALNCPLELQDKTMYFISIRAINMKNDVPLYGPHSKETESTLCFGIAEDISIGMVVGVAVGCTVGLIVLVAIVYWLLSWMKNEVALIKGIKIELPKGLDTPNENPLSSYDKFKKGLQTNHDNGIPTYERSYDRLSSFASEVDVKDVMENFVSSDELTQKEKRTHSGRNHSGESNNSGKGHDSISSTNTTKTHLSIDSGAEVDSPPSPDGFFSDTTSSSNTTPRSYKPDLAIVTEGTGSNSNDSGLEKEDPCSALQGRNIDLPSKFAWYVKKKNQPYTNILFQKNIVEQMPPYSKFSVIAPSTVSAYVRLGEQNLGLLDNHSLCNSEPSVADFEVGNDCQPLVLSGISPYSKFGLARSAGNGLNMGNQVNSQNFGYAKFGIVYRALKCQDFGSRDCTNPFVPSELKVCPKFLPSHPQAMPALTFNRNMVKGSKPPNLKSNESSDKLANSFGYSKFGNHHQTPKKNESQKGGYISFHEVLKKPAPENLQTTQPPNMAYSKFSVSTKPHDDSPLRSDSISSSSSDPSTSENKAYSNFGFTPEAPHDSGYISFQDAKIKFVECHPEKESGHNSHPCSINLKDISRKSSEDETDSNSHLDADECLDLSSDEVAYDLGTALSINPMTVDSMTIVSIDDDRDSDIALTLPAFTETQIPNDAIIEQSVSTREDSPVLDQPFSVSLLTGDSEMAEDIAEGHDTERSKPRMSCKMYVPLSELSREPANSAHVITQPNIVMTMPVENV